MIYVGDKPAALIDWMSFPIMGQYPFSSHSVGIGFVAYPASYPLGARIAFPKCNVTRSWSWPFTSI
jgi:hypothetical protein